MNSSGVVFNDYSPILTHQLTWGMTDCLTCVYFQSCLCSPGNIYSTHLWRFVVVCRDYNHRQQQNLHTVCFFGYRKSPFITLGTAHQDGSQTVVLSLYFRILVTLLISEKIGIIFIKCKINKECSKLNYANKFAINSDICKWLGNSNLKLKQVLNCGWIIVIRGK